MRFAIFSDLHAEGRDGALRRPKRVVSSWIYEYSPRVYTPWTPQRGVPTLGVVIAVIWGFSHRSES